MSNIPEKYTWEYLLKKLEESDKIAAEAEIENLSEDSFEDLSEDSFEDLSEDLFEDLPEDSFEAAPETSFEELPEEDNMAAETELEAPPEESAETAPKKASAEPRKQKVILSTRGLIKSFRTGAQEQQVLKNLDINVYANDFTVIMGASGAGKSTLLYALSGMDKVTGGRVRFLGTDIDCLSADKLAVFRRKNCGFVFQQMFLLDSMSVLDNILISGYLTSGSRKKIVAQAKELLTSVGLTETIWRKLPSQLSGGENQRAAIVRALINKPRVVFADEPTGSLNSMAGRAVLDVLTEINRDGQSIIMVTHDMNSALRGNRILYIRDGTIHGECGLGKYDEAKHEERHKKLDAFLREMGW